MAQWLEWKLRHRRAGFESQLALLFDKSVVFSAFLAKFQRISCIIFLDPCELCKLVIATGIAENDKNRSNHYLIKIEMIAYSDFKIFQMHGE